MQKGIIAIPDVGWMPSDFFQSFTKLKETDCEVSVQLIRGSLVHLAREKMVEIALRDNTDFVFFLDSDMTFPPTLLNDMLKYDEDIVSAMCYTKNPPYLPTVFTKCEQDSETHELKVERISFNKILDKPFYAEATGCACMLIKTRCFYSIKQPCFHPFPYAGEDVSFCYRARKAGLKILIDPTLDIGHVRQHPVGMMDYLKYKEEQNKLVDGSVL